MAILFTVLCASDPRAESMFSMQKKTQWNVEQNTNKAMPRMCFLSNALVKLKTACILHSLQAFG